MTPETDNQTTVRRYLEALERGTIGEELAAFFTEDVIVVEHPNRIVPDGATHYLNAILEGAKRGQQLMAAQRYEVKNLMANGDTVIAEVLWAGTLKIPLGSLPAGGQMRAHCVFIIELRDGKIARQRSYDCYEPW